MIAFLNFAPIEFMGGAERWLHEIATCIQSKEKTYLVSVTPKLASIYSRMVLGRSFEKRKKLKDDFLRTIEIKSCVPFSKHYVSIRAFFTEARRIYIKFELLEVVLLVYFGGFSSLQKTIVGVHSPFYYRSPVSFFDYLHNKIYVSNVTKILMKQAYKVHVITERDREFMTQRFGLNNVEYIPTSVDISIPESMPAQKKDTLRVFFAGELSLRKGVDVLVDLIKSAPETIRFDIAGNGPLVQDIIELTKYDPDCHYHGFLNQSQLSKLYQQADVFFLPSRAEGFPLVFHEAMAHGLLIVDSPEARVGLPAYVEQTVTNNKSDEYVKVLARIKSTHIQKEKIVDYYKNNLTQEKIMPQVYQKLFV